jgi:hypothetical protein
MAAEADPTCKAEIRHPDHPLFQSIDKKNIGKPDKRLSNTFTYKDILFGWTLFGLTDAYKTVAEDIVNLRQSNFGEAPVAKGGAAAAGGGGGGAAAAGGGGGVTAGRIPVENLCIIYTINPNKQWKTNEYVSAHWVCVFDLHLRNYIFNTKTFTNSIIELWSFKRNPNRTRDLGDELEAKMATIKVTNILNYYLTNILMWHYPGATIWLIARNERIAANYRKHKFIEVGPPYNPNIRVYSPLGTDAGGPGWCFMCPLIPGDIYTKIMNTTISLTDYFKENTVVKALVHGYSSGNLLAGCENFVVPPNVTLYIWNEKGYTLAYDIAAEILNRINGTPNSLQPLYRQLLAIPVFNTIESYDAVKEHLIDSIVPNIQQYALAKVYARKFGPGSTAQNHFYAFTSDNMREQGFYSLDGYCDTKLKIYNNKIKDFYDMCIELGRTFFTCKELLTYINEKNITKNPISIHVLSCSDTDIMPPEVKAAHDKEFNENRVRFEIAAIQNARLAYPEPEPVRSALFNCAKTLYDSLADKTPPEAQLLHSWGQGYAQCMQAGAANCTPIAVVAASGAAGGGGAAAAASGAAGGGGADYENTSMTSGGYRRTRRKLKQRRRINKRSKTFKTKV